MELIERRGGLGRFKLTGVEHEAWLELMNLFEKEKKKERGSNGLTWLYQKDKEIQTISATLFPFTSEERFAKHFSKACLDERERYYIHRNGEYYKVCLGEGDIKLSFKNYTYRGEVNLFTTLEKGNRSLLATMALNYTYDVVDDIASILGKGHQPPLIGPQPIRYRIDRDGLADLPHFKEIQQLYERAVGLTKEDGWAVVRDDHPLNMLRKDSLEHPNLAVREASEHMYKRKLAELLLANP